MYVPHRMKRALAVVGAATLVVSVAVPPTFAAVLDGAAQSTLGREPLLTPADLGSGNVDGLQFGDPTSKLALVDPPSANSDGGAHLSYPLVIPHGRGITPDLSLGYDSGGGNGWVGQGWDMSVGDISVDTRWGAARFDPAHESETYAIDGQMLVPNALGDTWAPRVPGDRQDYTRQVETEFQQVIRHEVAPGGPKNYYWEVHDKGGNVYWYGGKPDNGGPIGSVDGASDIDRSAIVTDRNGNQVRWLLSAQRDVGVNVMQYHYTTVRYSHGANGWVKAQTCVDSSSRLCAEHTYLRDILYTGAAGKSGQPLDPPYEVLFQRDSEVDTACTAVRKDPIVDAKSGYVDLTIDRLARIDVRHGSVPAKGSDPRTYDKLAVRYDLCYGEGAFGKSLLHSVSQVGSDGTTSATHTFDYANRVGTQTNGYNGFASADGWNTGKDLPDRLLLDSKASISALGGSESNAGEGHAYIGFNPLVPEKLGSIGGSLQIGGGATEAISEWLDINGDGLPDKVYRASTASDPNDVARNGPVMFRLNQSRPGGSTTFGDPEQAQGITKLSTEGNFSVEGALEAFPGVSVAFGLGAEVSWGDAYFADANSDGLPDYISGGTVYFNHLENGIPRFVANDSSATPVPIADGTANVQTPAAVQQAQTQLATQNPPVDTVRRWTAPFGGTVSVDAPVTLSLPPNATSPDGVRVAIQHGGTELTAANLLNAGSHAFDTPVAINVNAGDNIYFRVGSVSDGANDRVSWSPTITYSKIDGVADASTVPADVNGLSQTKYVAKDDFTLSGRPQTLVMMPYAGTIHFSATIDKAATSDDLSVVLLHNGVPVSVAAGSLAHDFVGNRSVSADFSVAAPVVPTDKSTKGKQDTVSVELVSKTPIDLHAVTWDPSIAYTAATGKDGQPIDLTARPLSFALTPEVAQYPLMTPQPSGPFTPSSGRHVGTAHVVFQVGKSDAGGTALVAIKTAHGVVAEGTVSLPKVLAGTASVGTDVSLNTDLAANEHYWFDVTVADATLSTVVSLSSFTLTKNNAQEKDLDVPATLHGAGLQGIFPLAYRGWAVAGYNSAGDRATKPLVENDFVIDPDAAKAKATEPTGFNQVQTDPPQPDKSFAFLPHLDPPTAPGETALASAVWSGNRVGIAASADTMSSSRLGVDSATPGTVPGGTGRAVTRIGVTGPIAKLAFAAGPLAASFGIAPSFGLVDYQDMNGDGFPDVITPSNITYTRPRGGYDPSSTGAPDLAVTNQDLTLSVGLGLESGLVDIKANSKGQTQSTQGGSAAKGSDANSDGGGVSIGASLNLGWTNPNASGPADSPAAPSGTADPTFTYADQLDQTPQDANGAGGAIQLGLGDVNGDGLPDRVFATAKGTWARYNLGYGFAAAPVQLSTGGFDSQESYSGGLSLGFATPWADFSGGAALNFDVDLSRYAWVDVNGDGILDQLHKINNTDPPTVRFGTGSGLLPPRTYGQMADAQITDQINAGQQIALDRSNGLGGQFDFTVAIGPLCLVACYLIINPGASYQNSVTSSEIDLQDVNGDGYADSVQSTDDNSLNVRTNKQADTNLLSTVHNPLGGTISMTYTRDGNTVDNPGSTWDMASVTVDDGRPGDGVNVRTTGYTYSGLKSDRLHRDSLGYRSVIETEFDAANTPLRRTTHTYLNNSIFDAGLETDTLVRDASDGSYLHGTRQTWTLRPVSPTSNLHFDSPASLGYSVAPLLAKVVQEVGTGTGGVVGQSTSTEYTYDSLGDVTRQADLGEVDDPNDDVVNDYVYTRCDFASDLAPEARPCAGDTAHDNPSPFFADTLCGTWVSIPAEITVTNGKTGADRVLYRHRQGGTALCDNASVTHLEETIGDGQMAQTELNYDAWGSYNRIVYPLGANGKRYAVQYVWDGDGHGNIADVTEYELDPSAVDDFMGDGLTASDAGHYTTGLRSRAEFDPLSGDIASRTDANGNTISYGYDPLGRIASVSSPVASDPAPLITYDYTLAPGNSHVIAHHFDVFHPSDTIDTATFVDGTGRVVQTKRDAAVFQGAGSAAQVGIVASGTTTYDALGRPTNQYNPRSSTAPMGTFDDAAPAQTDPHSVTTYDLWDEPTSSEAPGQRLTTTQYDYGSVDPNGPQLFKTTETAPNGRQTVTYSDVRNVIRATDDVPVGAPTQRMRYESDGMGQALRTTDPTGNVTTNSYDLMGRRTSTTTPDGGKVDFGYDPDGEQISKTTPNLRAQPGQQITYTYDMHRLTGIKYPTAADNVTYLYGGQNAPDNGAGQVIREEDGSRIASNAYDPAGNLVQQTATIKLHDWTPAADQSRFTWTTKWAYDGLGRMKAMVYPDSTQLNFTAAYNNGQATGTDSGERLSYDYDAGGQLKSISGQEDGVQTKQVGTNLDGTPIYAQLPQTWQYSYLADRQYDVFLHRRSDTLGNGDATEFTYDANTQWLVHQRTLSINRDLKGQSVAYQEIQDLKYTYDSIGNPTSSSNDLPAAVPNLFGGPSSQTYSYDPYGRLTNATGKWQQATDKLRRYSLGLAYDAAGNLTSKNQKDEIFNGNKSLTQTATTYSFGSTFTNPAPHQASVINNQKVSYDPDGNLTRIVDSKGKDVRAVTWDGTDHLRSVTDGPATTTYNYDDAGNRTIERGPGGETATLNPWVTIVNGSPMWKHILAGDDRISTQRDDGGNQESMQYFLHKDLQGSTNVVTDISGNTFQHHEYFATGEIWVDEKSTVFRTPYQYAGGYLDEQRSLINFGARWYDQNRGMFYSPEPMLTMDPAALQEQPMLRSAYSYAQSNPVGYVDPTGLRPIRPGHTKADDARIHHDRSTLIARFDAGTLPRSMKDDAAQIKQKQLRQEKFETIDDIAMPFVEINVSTGEVTLSPGLFVSKSFGGTKPASTTTTKSGTAGSATSGGNGPVVNAAGGTGGPVTSASSGGNAATQSAANSGVGTGDPGKGITAPRRPPPKPLPKPPAPVGSQ
jgi:RHS repeat-associated protein